MVFSTHALVHVSDVSQINDVVSGDPSLRGPANHSLWNCRQFMGCTNFESREDDQGGAVAATGNSSFRRCVRHLFANVRICSTFH